MAGSYGIDLSNNNGKLDIHKSGLKPSFIYAKCTEGTGYVDPLYDYYAQQAEDNDAQFGAYHFFHAEKLDARAEAENFVTRARPRSMLSCWLDYETYGASGQADAEEIGLFISYAKVLVPKIRIGLYVNGYALGRISPYLKEIPFNGIWFASLGGHIAPQTKPIEWGVNQYAIDNGVSHDYSTATAQGMRDYWTWT
jgi:GH25 family lysozyme M1 (1,4-beta-N-acetylmuramidase)